MPTIKQGGRILKRIFLANLTSTNNKYITLLLCGPHGCGKSQVVEDVTRDQLGGYCFTIECSTLGMGELPGLPFVHKDSDNNSEVRFVPYHVINTIKRLEKFYYDKALNEGFLGGKVKLVVEDGVYYLTEFDKKHKIKDKLDEVVQGEDNKYSLGNDLSFATKLALLESGEIRPVIINMDEINRCENQTMREIMNFLLQRRINGYTLPWWCSIVGSENPCSQNSAYMTNDMDDAQVSRFLKINVDTPFEDWIEYALDKNLNAKVVKALANLEGSCFVSRSRSQEDEQEMTPDQRAWEMIANLYDSFDVVNTTKYFTQEEKSKLSDDIRTIVKGKVGGTAGMDFLASYDRSNEFISSEDIINGKSKEIDPEILKKFNNSKSLMQLAIIKALCNYIINNAATIVGGEKSSDAKKKTEYKNYMSQISQFVTLLDATYQFTFIDTLRKLPEGRKIYLAIAVDFSDDVLTNIGSSLSEVTKINNQ